MKAKVITKLLIGSSLAMVAIAPILTLSSCASISQWNLPIVIGGIGDKNPWSNISDALNKHDSKGYGFSDPPTDTEKYFSPQSDFNYLPTNFISYTDRSASTDNYAFVKTYNDQNWDKTDENKNKSLYYDPKWVDYNDKHLSQITRNYDISSSDDKTKKTLTTYTSIQNANLYNALSLTSLASGVNIYTSGLLKLMTEDAVMNPKLEADWYNALFGDINNKSIGGLNHGGEGSANEQNKQFYEFLFDLLDNLSEGKLAAKFAESAANFKFSSQIYGPGPYISWENETGADKAKQFVGRDADANQFTFTENDIKSGSTTEEVVSTDDDGGSVHLSNNFVLNGATDQGRTVSARAAYTAFASATTDSSLENKFYPNTISVQVPFLINPGDFGYSFYNPLTKHSFQQNDYLLDDITPVKNQVSKTNAWNNFSKHVDTSSQSQWKDKTSWVNASSWNFNTNPNGANANTFYPSYPNAASFFGKDDGKLDETKANYIDPTIVSILSQNNTTGNPIIQPNSYIAFANYTFAAFPTSIDPDNVSYDCMPIFAGIAADSSSGAPAVFPISLLFKSPDLVNDSPTNPTTLDYDLFKQQLMPEANALYNYKQSDNKETPYNNDPFKNNPHNNMYYLDLDKLFEKENKAYSLFNTNISLNKTPLDYYNENKDTFQTIWDLFGSWEHVGTNWVMQATDSSKLFTPINNAN